MYDDCPISDWEVGRNTIYLTIAVRLGYTHIGRSVQVVSVVSVFEKLKVRTGGMIWANSVPTATLYPCGHSVIDCTESCSCSQRPATFSWRPNSLTLIWYFGFDTFELIKMKVANDGKADQTQIPQPNCSVQTVQQPRRTVHGQRFCEVRV